MTRALQLVALIAVAACADASTDSVIHAVRDSAGVQIVSTMLPESNDWLVDSIPFVDIGTLDGADGQDLSLPWASRRLRDGRVAISNANSNELRFYGPDGRFIRAVGGSGEGPGEFGLIASISVTRDGRLVVADATQPRLNIFQSNGEFVRTVRVEPINGRMPRLRGLVDDRATS